MEHKTLEKNDIEKCKELFEYEMTEVILKLKGEFAAVSARDMKYTAVAVDDQKLNVAPIKMPKADLELTNVDVPSVPLVTKNKIQISKLSAATSKEKIEVPVLPGQVVSVQITPAEIKKHQIAFSAIGSIQVKKPVLSEVSGKAVEIPASTDIKNFCDRIGKSELQLQDIAGQSVHIQIPNIPATVRQKNPTVKIEKCKTFIPELPEISVGSKNCTTDIQPKKTIVPDVPQIRNVSIKAVDKFGNMSIEMPKLPKIHMADKIAPDQALISWASLATPAVGQINVSTELSQITMEAPKLKVPEILKINMDDHKSSTQALISQTSLVVPAIEKVCIPTELNQVTFETLKVKVPDALHVPKTISISKPEVLAQVKPPVLPGNVTVAALTPIHMDKMNIGVPAVPNLKINPCYFNVAYEKKFVFSKTIKPAVNTAFTVEIHNPSIHVAPIYKPEINSIIHAEVRKPSVSIGQLKKPAVQTGATFNIEVDPMNIPMPELLEGRLLTKRNGIMPVQMSAISCLDFKIPDVNLSAELHPVQVKKTSLIYSTEPVECQRALQNVLDMIAIEKK